MNFNEALNWINQTNYERENNITILNKRIILDKGDIKLIGVDKSTGEVGLVVIYRTSVRKDTWSVWYPSENQMESIEELKTYYDKINKENSKQWKSR